GAAGAGAAGGAAGAGAAGGAVGTGDPGAEGTGSVSAVSGGTLAAAAVLRSASSAGSRLPAFSWSSSSVPESTICPVPRVPLPSPPASSLPAGPDPASDSLRAASPCVTRFLATAVTVPLFESTVASALVVTSSVVLTGHADASWVDDLATQRSSHGYTFSLGSGSVSSRSTRSSSVLSSSCEAEIYAGAMAAQELRWLTYLLTDLGEAPCSPPVMYVDNKAMLALCQEHRLEHRTKHVALLESCSNVASFVLLKWPLRPTLLMFSPRHFSLVIISVSALF
ncbi:unnamed protein product, partial [Closterium sp. NIES-53]